MDDSVFYIRLQPPASGNERLGEIRIDSFTERFAVELFPDKPNLLVEHWRDALRSLVSGKAAIALPTSPLMTWVLYRADNRVLVQQMLILCRTGPRLLADGTVDQIPDHREVNEDGVPISQWTTNVNAIVSFLSQTAEEQS